MSGAIQIAALVLASSFLVACGGGGGSTAGSGGPAPGPPSGGGGPTSPTGAVVTPTPVTVAAGQTTTGVDITVPSGASAMNTEVLGVADPGGGGSAFSTGASVARGATARVLLFGNGLTGSARVSISGPSDISISNVQGITATDDTPGVAFTIAVDSNAAPGARTVTLRDTKDNITTFTGGLEVR